MCTVIIVIGLIITVKIINPICQFWIKIFLIHVFSIQIMLAKLKNGTKIFFELRLINISNLQVYILLVGISMISKHLLDY